MSWQEWKGHNLEEQFNPPKALGAKTDDVLASWNSKSMAARSQLTGSVDIPYGDHALMCFDYHPGVAHMPVIINIHGGYWRALDKSAMQHHMADLARSGFSTVNLNYPLCPEMSLTDIVITLEQAIETIIDLVMQSVPNSRFVLFGIPQAHILQRIFLTTPTLRKSCPVL
jgi:acetyl esterase/lipase